MMAFNKPTWCDRCLLILTVFLFVGCGQLAENGRTPINKNTHGALLTKRPQNCGPVAENFAKIICGDYDRRGSRITERKEGLELTTQLLSEHRGDIDLGEQVLYSSRKEDYYNVLREHLAGELQDVRVCSMEMGKLAKSDCELQNCRLSCKKEEQAQLQAYAEDRAAECIQSKKNLCRANCNLKQGKNCDRVCSTTSNTGWQQACQSRSNRISNKHIHTAEKQRQDCELACP